MRRNRELQHLVPVLLIIITGSFLLYAGCLDKELPATLMTRSGTLDLTLYTTLPFPNAFYGFLFALLFLLLHTYLRLRLPEADPYLLPALALLSGTGLILSLRLAPDLAIFRNEAIQATLAHHPGAQITDNVQTLAGLGVKHFIYLIFGILLILACLSFFDQRPWAWLASKKYFWVMISVGLIFLTLIFGKKINGRTLWLFGFQTVELVKLLMLFFLAGYIYEKGKGLLLYRKADFRTWLAYAGPFMVMWFFALVPLFLQRDLGPTFLIFIVFLVMFFGAGNRLLITGFFILIIAVAGYLSYQSGFPAMVRERFDLLFDPFGRNESMARALWTISRGGLWGSGIGFGEPYQIPQVQSDYTFAAICEEMGFIGGTSVILAYLVMIHRCFRISARIPHLYKKTLVLGIGVLTGVQAGIIILGNLGLIPLTGITLPLVSYGGSSLVIQFLMTGIVLKISGESNAD